MIYVETTIKGSMDEVWEKTQNPSLHQLWDLRFSSITYLPRAEGEPQRFTYSTNLGFGLRIEGWGESVGERSTDGSRTSALKFGSEQGLSLIRTGSGYWKYTEDGDSVRFVTGYDYKPRWGLFGRLASIVFRPWMAWATAWSFDCLRLWIERQLPPQIAFRSWLVATLARYALAFIWLWHGLVPKLIVHHPDEAAMLTEAHLSQGLADRLVSVAGVIECVLALVFVFGVRQKWNWWLTVIGMPLLAAGVVINAPWRAVYPFDPITLNLAMAALAAIGLAASKDAPSATNCLWGPWKPISS